jgi:Lipopolysaccharide-assembly
MDRRLLLLLGCILLPGCLGYTVGPVQPTFMKGIHRIAVPIFENRTVEPEMDALATTTVIKQLQQDGTYEISGLDQADAELKGVVLDVVRIKARSVVGNILASSEFNLSVKMRFSVVNPHSNAVLGTRDISGTSRYFVGNDVQTQEHQAIPLAIEDAAVQVASYLSEGW